MSNSAGNASNQLNQPTDVALVHPNLIYISDYNNHRVQQYQLGSSTGMTVAGQANGLGGSSLNQLNHPTCIFVDSSDGIFVSDSDNNPFNIGLMVLLQEQQLPVVQLVSQRKEIRRNSSQDIFSCH